MFGLGFTSVTELSAAVAGGTDRQVIRNATTPNKLRVFIGILRSWFCSFTELLRVIKRFDKAIHRSPVIRVPLKQLGADDSLVVEDKRDVVRDAIVWCLRFLVANSVRINRLAADIRQQRKG